MRSIASLIFMVAVVMQVGCRPRSETVHERTDHAHQEVGPSKYPVATDPKKVGTYPALTKSGGGYFYDEVLEYRVWIHSPAGGDDSFHAFATYEHAEQFARQTTGAEKPLVLVRQLEHINEPKGGVYEHIKGDRLTEWLPEWLEGSKRADDSIANFLRNPRPMRISEER